MHGSSPREAERHEPVDEGIVVLVREQVVVARAIDHLRR
jgi:hypothetical protein